MKKTLKLLKPEKKPKKKVKLFIMANFYVVATPIGNLGDISPRALNALREANLILAEDTRVTKNLLNHFGLETPIVSYHQHSKIAKINEILARLREGQNLALVSDAGTPGISDPGGQLVEAIVKELGDSVKIEPIPGPSAITALASVCGFAMDRFLFLGFPPAKNKRQKFFEEVMVCKYPVIFYESCHRILRTLNDLSVISSSQNADSKFRNLEISLVVGRELTKKFETIYRGSTSEVLEAIKKHAPAGQPKGEFVVAINKSAK